MARGLAAACVTLSLLLGGCASVRFGRSLEVPEQGRLYVAVFVDETPAGEVGVPLAEAIKIEIFRRDPDLLSVVFDEGSVALDGTVLALEERRAEEGRFALQVRASAVLINRAGEVVADLGKVSSRATYPIAGSPAETEAARARALEGALRALAQELLRRVDREARAQPDAVTQGRADA